MQYPSLILKLLDAAKGFWGALLSELERQYVESICLWNSCQYANPPSIGLDSEGGYSYTYTCERCQTPVTVPERLLPVFQRTHDL